VFSFLKSSTQTSALNTDLHSHLIPGIDDGVRDWDDALQIAIYLSKLGYKKAITTPHIMADYYENTPETIRTGVNELNRILEEKEIELKIEPGAEYFLDSHLYKQIQNNEDFLTFGDGYILIETSFMNKPFFFSEAFFHLQSSGYKPILAHPERYQFLHEEKNLLHEMFEKGVYFQINLMSLTGYYSIEVRRFSEYLISNKMVHFLGSDLHRAQQLKIIDEAIHTKLYQKVRQLSLLNDTL